MCVFGVESAPSMEQGVIETMLNRKRIAIAAIAAAAMLNLSCSNAAKTPVPARQDATVTGATLPLPLPKIPDRVFDVTKYGTVADGRTNDAKAIQRALDDANSAGGGRVVIPAGTYLSGPIRLGNRTELHLAEGAMLKAVPFLLYPQVNGDWPNFVAAYNVHDVGLSGTGTIDGQGDQWWEGVRTGMLTEKRPHLVYLSGVKRAYVRDLHLQNSPKFHLVLSPASDVTIENITIEAPWFGPNTDGVDIKGTNVLVTRCSISGGDDNVAIDGPASKITVTDCWFGRGHGLSIGSYTRGGVDNVLADNITFEGTDNGIRGKSQRQRGGIVQNLSYSNMTMHGVGTAITFSSYYEGRSNDPRSDTAEAVTVLTPVWRNATFTNITCVDAPARSAGMLWGLPEAPIENFRFRNVNIKAARPFEVVHADNVAFSDDSTIVATSGDSDVLTFDAQNVKTPAQSRTSGFEALTNRR
jgi:polygalacturonase